MCFVVLCVAGGALLGIAPFLLEYDALVKVAEAGALTTVVSATEEPGGHRQPNQRRDRQVAGRAGAGGQDRRGGQGNRGSDDRRSAGVHGIHEARQRQRAGQRCGWRWRSSRRGEGEWLQVLVRMLDHVYALHQGASRSGQPKLIEQVGNFQNGLPRLQRAASG